MYCIPILAKTDYNFFMIVINGLIFNYGFYFIVRYLNKKKKLDFSKDKTRNTLKFITYFIVFLYIGIAFFYMIMILWLQVFTLIGALLRVVFAIDVANRINRDIKKGEIK